MSNKRISMTVVEEILRLKNQNKTQRKIAKILGIDRATVAKHWSRLAFDSRPTVQPPDWAMQVDWNYIKREVAKGIAITVLYDELSEANILPNYSNFCRYLRLNIIEKKQKDITVRITRTPGDSIEVDYSGNTFPIINPATGEITEAQLFVAAMSYSGHFYAEFTLTQTQDDFIKVHNNMFAFFGGVPRYIIPDNCKTAVIKADKYDPEINATYHDMCVHYDVAIDPARAVHPKDKPNVERAVGILQQDFFQRIRNKTYTSLKELNRDLLTYINNKVLDIIQNRGKSRIELFQEELPLLKKLPPTPYEIFYFKKAKVHHDCHIQLNNNFYSVPYRFVGKEVKVKYNSSLVHIYLNCDLLATHTHQRGKKIYSTNNAHYPEKKIVDLNMSILSLETEAKKIGPNMATLVNKLFREVRYPLKNLRKVQGVLALSKKFSIIALDQAAVTAMEFDRTTFAYIKSCASNYSKPQEETITKAPMRQLELICLQGDRL